MTAKDKTKIVQITFIILFLAILALQLRGCFDKHDAADNPSAPIIIPPPPDITATNKTSEDIQFDF